LDRKLLEEQKDIECQQKRKLDDMKPRIKYPFRIPRKYESTSDSLVVNRGDKYDQKFGERSNEVAT